jgi:hypothetical protein
MLNRLKEMKGRIIIYTSLGTWFNEAYKEASICASNKEAFREPS